MTRRVLRPVPALEERLRVLELVGHVLDVLEEAHRRVLVGVRREGVLALHLDQLAGPGSALFLLYSPSTARASVLKAASRVVEVLEAVGLDLEDRLEVLLGEGGVVVRVVVGGVGVLARARPASGSPGTSRAGRPCVPRNIMCSKKWAKPDLPGSTSLREPVCTGICSDTMFGKPVGTTITLRPFAQRASRWRRRAGCGRWPGLRTRRSRPRERRRAGMERALHRALHS